MNRDQFCFNLSVQTKIPLHSALMVCKINNQPDFFSQNLTTTCSAPDEGDEENDEAASSSTSR